MSHARNSTSRSTTTELARSSWANNFRGLPTIVKSLTVAALSAGVTVIAAVAWHAVYPAKQPAKTAMVDNLSNQQSDAQNQLTSLAGEQKDSSHPGAVLSLPRGFHTGVIRGLIPGKEIPLALISQDDIQGTIIILGLEGWMPTLATPSTEDSEGKSSTFRSNGLILRFDREMSSDKITGTVTDVVTGESGTWIVEKTS